MGPLEMLGAPMATPRSVARPKLVVLNPFRVEIYQQLIDPKNHQKLPWQYVRALGVAAAQGPGIKNLCIFAGTPSPGVTKQNFPGMNCAFDDTHASFTMSDGSTIRMQKYQRLIVYGGQNSATMVIGAGGGDPSASSGSSWYEQKLGPWPLWYYPAGAGALGVVGLVIRKWLSRKGV